ncbi:AHH domain-containing protein [Novosphingobium soli]|uniref:AHH domain-containing protein n=1 Tax=Novosphingobium soli TaxID=574956 RepID=A0ABV6CUT9_9SPHN
MRRSLPFRAVNRNGAPGYDPGLQRHHLLPRQLLRRAAFARMFATIGDPGIRFEDFRENGLLLPCREAAALRMGLPLHRGPHRLYSQLVAERMGQIESAWSLAHARDPQGAAVQARMRMDLLQRALRRYLLSGRAGKIRLNRLDPLGAGIDFTDLDHMAEALWGSTAAAGWSVSPGTDPPPIQAMPTRAARSARAD